jgi:hypothetical protein
MPNTYTLETCEKLINTYVNEFGGEAVTLREGTLGLGLVLLTADKKKSVIIHEVYLNEWSSGHTIRMYNKLPKKYGKRIHEARA